MDLDQLRSAVTVADCGSFSRAATILGVSQPAISMSVARLEAELDVSLFRRNNQGSVVTPSGKKVIAAARRVLRTADELRAVAGDAMNSDESATLEVAVATSLVPLTNRILSHLRRELPMVRIGLQITEGHRTPLSYLRSGRADIAVCYLQDIAPDVVSTPIGEEELLVAFPPGTKRGPEAVSAGELAAGPLIGPRKGSTLREAWDLIFESRGVTPDPRVEVTEPEMMVECVYAGLGATVISSWLLIGAFAHCGLVLRRLAPRQILRVGTAHVPGNASTSVASIQKMIADGAFASLHSSVRLPKR